MSESQAKRLVRTGFMSLLAGELKALFTQTVRQIDDLDPRDESDYRFMIELPFQKLQRRVPLEIMILMLDMCHILL